MSTSFESFYESNRILLREILRKSYLDDSLTEGNLLYLLSEGELDQPDVEALRSSTSQLKQFLADVLKVEALSTKLPSAAAWYQAQGRNVQAAEKFVMKLDMNKPKGAKDWVKSVFGKGFTVANGVATVALIDTMAAGGLKALGEATALIKRNLEGKLADDAKLVDIPPDTGLTKEDVAAAIKKAFEKSMGNEDLKDSQSLMKKIGGKAAKMPGVALSEFPLDNVMPEIMELTLPELGSLVEALTDVPTPDDTAVDDATQNADAKDGGGSEEVDDVLTADEVGKAGQIWLDKLKADGADANLLKLGQQWMAAVSKDPEFKKIAGLSESYNSSLSFLLFEQVKWPDLIAVFAKNAPGPLKGVGGDVIEPLIAPFAQALVDQGLQVVDKSGNPMQPPVADTDDAVQDVEEDIPEDVDTDADAEDSVLDRVVNLFKDLGKIGLSDPKKAAELLWDEFGLDKLDKEKKVEESRRRNSQPLIFEKAIPYPTVQNIIYDLLPDDDKQGIEIISKIDELISGEFGEEYGVEDIPEPGSEEAATPLSRKDLLSKAKSDNRLGTPGELIINAMIDGGLFDDMGIKVERALRNRTLSILLEEKLDGETFYAAYELASEENPEVFKDLEIADLVSSLNGFFADNEIDIEVEVPDVEEEPEAEEEQEAEEAEEEVDPNAEMDIEDPAGVSDEEQEKLDAEAKQAAGDLGKIPIDKMSLAKILKKHPDIVGQGQKATRARRKLRQAINLAAGMEVFAENFDYGSYEREKYILNESSENDALSRWRKLAGIQDD